MFNTFPTRQDNEAHGTSRLNSMSVSFFKKKTHIEIISGKFCLEKVESPVSTCEKLHTVHHNQELRHIQQQGIIWLASKVEMLVSKVEIPC